MTTTCEPDIGSPALRHPTCATAHTGTGPRAAQNGRVAAQHPIVALGAGLWLLGVICSTRLFVVALGEPALENLMWFAVVAAATGVFTHCLRGRLGATH